MKLNKITATLLALGLAGPVWADFKIADFRVEGEQHTTETTVRSLLPVKVGDTYSEQTGEEIIRALYASGFYENVLLEQNGNMLIITVKERPIISDITVTGAKVLQNDNILKQMSGVRGSVSGNDEDVVSNNRTSRVMTAKCQTSTVPLMKTLPTPLPLPVWPKVIFSARKR